jgi:flagellin
LAFTSFNGGTPVNVIFGDGSGGTVKTLDQLNAQLLANNLQATIDPTGKLTITPTNDYAFSTLGTVASGGVIGGPSPARSRSRPRRCLSLTPRRSPSAATW